MSVVAPADTGNCLEAVDETDALPALTADVRWYGCIRLGGTNPGAKRLVWSKVQDQTIRLSRELFEALLEGIGFGAAGDGVAEKRGAAFACNTPSLE